MTTDTARVTRNRANAQKSTGPRTPAGKKRSSQNARTHGLSSTTAPTDLPVPDPCANLTFTTTLQELIEEHRPATPTQLALVRELALTLWKLDYAPRIEHRLLNTPLPDAQDIPQPDPKHITPHPRLDHDLDPTAKVLAAHFASNGPTPLTRFFAHLNRLQARTNSLLNQLHRLQRAQHRHAEDADGTTWARAYNARNKPDHAALQEESRRIHHENQRRAAAAAARRNTDPPPPSPAGPTDLRSPNDATPVGEGRGEGRADVRSAQAPAPPRSPAQNEPTPPPPSPRSVSSVSSVAAHSPAPAQHGAAPRNTAQQLFPPAQNEPTTDNEQRTMDQGPITPHLPALPLNPHPQ